MGTWLCAAGLPLCLQCRNPIQRSAVRGPGGLTPPPPPLAGMGGAPLSSGVAPPPADEKRTRPVGPAATRLVTPPDRYAGQPAGAAARAVPATGRRPLRVETRAVCTHPSIAVQQGHPSPPGRETTLGAAGTGAPRPFSSPAVGAEPRGPRKGRVTNTVAQGGEEDGRPYFSPPPPAHLLVHGSAASGPTLPRR